MEMSIRRGKETELVEFGRRFDIEERYTDRDRDWERE